MIGLAAPIVLPYTEDQWARFIAEHSLGAFALAWIAGITFMLTMTIFVLQLREVLHPDILAKFIRPQVLHLTSLRYLSLHCRCAVSNMALTLCVRLLLLIGAPCRTDQLSHQGTRTCSFPQSDHFSRSISRYHDRACVSTSSANRACL